MAAASEPIKPVRQLLKSHFLRLRPCCFSSTSPLPLLIASLYSRDGVGGLLGPGPARKWRRLKLRKDGLAPVLAMNCLCAYEAQERMRRAGARRRRRRAATAAARPQRGGLFASETSTSGSASDDSTALATPSTQHILTPKNSLPAR